MNIPNFSLGHEIRKMNPELGWVVPNLLFLHVGGSRLYGTNGPGSDWDIRGITLAPRDYWIGAKRFQSIEFKLPQFDADVVIYDIRRWLQLAVDVNPNIVETLYIEHGNECILKSSEHWDKLRQRILPLISQRAYDGFHGYSSSQLKKMMVKQANKTGRVEIAEEHGYDTKFAMHGFRIAEQGRELLLDGRMTFPRPNAEILRDIREGKVFDDAQDCIAHWELASSELGQALVDSILPAKADFDAYNDLLMEIYDEMVQGSR